MAGRLPMSEWNDKALAKLKGELKINVKMIKIIDILETAAGGFMDRAEALSVTVRIGDAEQMGQVIEILRGKGDQEFIAFCTMLRRSNYEVWANQLESSAEWFKNAPGTGNEKQHRIASLEDEVKTVKQQLVDVHSELILKLKQDPKTDQKEKSRSREEEKKGTTEQSDIHGCSLNGDECSSDIEFRLWKVKDKELSAYMSVPIVPGQLARVATAATRGSHPQAVALNPVVVAARYGQLSTMKKLLDGGAATAEDQDENGRTALLWASGYGHLPVVRELLDVYKVNVFHKDKFGQNALHIAADTGHLEMVKYLLPKFGQKKFDVDSNSHTCLTLAIQQQKQDVVDYLLEHGGFGSQQ